MSSVLPLAFEIGSMVVLVAILILDLALIIRRPHVPTMREASLWVGFYVLLALVFAGIIFLLGDVQHGTEFLAGWLTEYSLSIDNLFVFVLILGAFKVPSAYQQRALMIGIVLALVFRGIFILAGAALIERFIWIFFIFGAWLVWTAWQQVKPGGHEDQGDSWLIRKVKQVLPFSDDFDGGKLRTVVDGKRMFTPFLLVLISLGATDLLFALDSIPAIFGITQSPFIVFTANVFALMGLRQLYFLLGGLLERLEYLKYGIAAILAFIGVKLILHALHENELPFINGGEHVNVPDVSTMMSLGFIVLAMVVATIASVIKMRRDAAKAGDRIHLGANEKAHRE
ncbi:TerC/Alx family metal homeostasis membrane protein [Leucobacter coleopterorum]|uniref:TerC/Alx family metal homeostasis membrane protein n=1 Tax=Leucobacter coleopterorum TaxID=2714933 RepID=A0ABX6JWE3_9MICO|nr:TerC/Alx family metal homeostasis membrane protein [Leucobacter coleopterorum]QIM18624.1 TerC/Alx family metal homeostasis membrane protein [Leucobacter coleopterorum]